MFLIGPIKFNRYYIIKFKQVPGCHVAKKYIIKLKNKVWKRGETLNGEKFSPIRQFIIAPKQFPCRKRRKLSLGQNVYESSIHAEILGCQCQNYQRFRRFIATAFSSPTHMVCIFIGSINTELSSLIYKVYVYLLKIWVNLLTSIF